MRLALLTALTMVAFAANSILNRLALSTQDIGPAAFAAVRVASGAVVLVLLLALRDRKVPAPARPVLPAIGGLAAYMLGFSFAYVSMDAGVGALTLFGIVQVTMFAGALTEGDRPPARRWLGMALALTGLAILTLPSGPVAVAPGALLLMGCAAVGWGIYSLIGRGVTDPLAATAWNFVYCLPVVALALILWPDSMGTTGRGLVLAVLSGGVTSALGYALWYALLPSLGATRAALTQLSAPVIALVLGAVLLGEAVSVTAVLSAALILGGIAVGVVPMRRAR
nr:DMT family transporter [Oceanicola sp. 22II-s10i]